MKLIPRIKKLFSRKPNPSVADSGWFGARTSVVDRIDAIAAEEGLALNAWQREVLEAFYRLPRSLDDLQSGGVKLCTHLAVSPAA